MNADAETLGETLNMYKKIVFDLDGTLTDSGRGILASVVLSGRRWPAAL